MATRASTLVPLCVLQCLLACAGTGSASAQRLPAIVVPSHYDLAFTIDLARQAFEGTETIQVAVAQPTSTIVLHAVGLQFETVSVGTGASAQPATITLDDNAQTATLTVARTLAPGPTEIHARYTGVLGDSLRGLYLSRGTTRNYAVTQFESTDARRAFPCFDEPAFKATFTLTLTIDRGDTAISNGRIVSDTPGPGPTQHTLAFSPTPKMSTYLVAMAVGDFTCTGGTTDGTPIRICATPDKRDLTRIALESVGHILSFYNRYYAIKYPFGKLDVLAVPDFAAGAMENTAAIFYRETDLLADAKTASVATRKRIASVLAHEMAHQWFGDLVTMQWWDDIWLNEGFATWMANRPLAAWKPEWEIAVDEGLETQAALNLDALKSTRPIHSPVTTPAEIDAAFDTIAYEKGAAVLRMIERTVGAETFRNGINRYLEAHAYGNAKSEDFWTAIAAASGRPIDRILPTFVHQPGAPLLDVSLSCVADRPALTLAQQRFFLTTDDTSPRPATEWQVPFCVKTGAAQQATCDVLAETRRTIPLGGRCTPWIFANAGATGYYRTAYPPEMLRALAPNVQTNLTASERLSLVSDEWALVRSGRHSTADYLTLATGFGGEHTAGVLGQVVDRLEFIHEYLTTATTAPRLEAFARSLFAPLASTLGTVPRPEDDDARRELRAVVIGALGSFANDPDVIRTATDSLNGALEGAHSGAAPGAAPLDGTLAHPLIRAAAIHGDTRLYERLVAAVDTAVSPDERYRYFNAAAEFRDPAIIDRALLAVLSPEVRNQDASLYFQRFFRNPVARPRAWAFLKAHWTELEPRITIFGGDTGLASAVGAFCDAPTRDDITAFFAAHPMRSAARTIDLSLERINNCIALKAQQTAVVANWLDGIKN